MKNNLKSLREKAGHTQESLAASTGLSKSTIYSIEGGLKGLRFSFESAVLIARKLNHELTDIWPEAKAKRGKKS